jgi:PAS domain S-box-containing protein
MRLSFRLKTILGVAAIEAVLLTALVVSGVGFLSSSAEAEFERRTQATVKAFSVVAKEALISSDLAALNALAREMLTYPGVVYARVRDADHQVIARAGDAAQLDKSVAENPTLASVTDGVLRTGVDIQVGSQRFGRVEIGVSAGEVQSVQATAQRYGLGLAALEMLLVALFSWALGAYLTRQLARLSQAAKRIAGGELGYQMPVQGGDELAETATAFNRMSLQLADSYAALHHNEQDLRLRGHILGAIGVGIVIADARTPDQSVVYVNQAFERITGWLSQDVLGRNCRFLQGPHTDPAELRRLRDAIAEGRDVDVLLLNYTRQGRPFWNELHVMPVRNHAGELTHFVALQTDVSSRIEAQQAITRSEEQLRRVLNATHDGIIVIDDRGAIVSFNAGAERLFGYTVEEVHGRNISMIVPEPHRAHHDAYLQRYLATGESRIMGLEREFEAQRKDGVSIWIALRVGVLEGEPGTPASRDGRRRFIGVVHDITERKRGEVELRHAKEAAEDAAIAKSEFLASMSHEIRTPMHGVLGSIEMLQDTALTGQQQRYLETARTSAGMLLGVIDEILDFSRLEAGKLRIEALDFDPRRTVEDVTAMLAQRAHSKKLELACYIAPEVPELMRGDPIRLRQVLVNLVGNAIKFTERGEVVVSVSAVPGLGSERVLRIEVRDTGIGIARDKQATLFQPFTQADSSMSRRFGGSGLGLSIAKRLVELMQGSIGFESVAEQGSRFWFTSAAAEGHSGLARRTQPGLCRHAGAGGGRQRHQPHHPAPLPHRLGQPVEQCGQRRGGLGQTAGRGHLGPALRDRPARPEHARHGRLHPGAADPAGSGAGGHAADHAELVGAGHRAHRGPGRGRVAGQTAAPVRPARCHRHRAAPTRAGTRAAGRAQWHHTAVRGRARPAGRGQPGHAGRGHADAAQARPGRRSGRRWPASGGPSPATGLRPGVDGHPDARHGRLCGHPRDPRLGGRERATAHAHRRPDRACTARRPRPLPGRRHGRLHRQALQRPGAGHHGGPLADAARRRRSGPCRYGPGPPGSARRSGDRHRPLRPGVGRDGRGHGPAARQGDRDHGQ